MKKMAIRIVTYLMVFVLAFSTISCTCYDFNTVSAASTSSTVSIKSRPIMKASSVKTSSVKLSWSKTKSATSYKIYRSTNKKAWTLIKTTKSTSYTVSKLTAGKKYYFRIRAYKSKTKSPYSKIVTVTPKPTKVTGVTAKSKTCKQIRLSWNKVSGATGYSVYMYSSSSKKWKRITTTQSTSYTAKGLSVGTSYKFRVKAYKKQGSKYVFGSYSVTYTTPTYGASYLIGKTLGEVKAMYGQVYSYTFYEGGQFIFYKKAQIAFLLNGISDCPTDDTAIMGVLSVGNSKVFAGLTGGMTYPQINKAVSKKVKLSKPEYWYNQMDDVWMYSLSFKYNGYNVSYSWDADPNKNKSSEIYVTKNVDPSKVVAPSTPDYNTSLRDAAYAYLKKKDSSIYGLVFYSDNEGILSYTIKSLSYNYYGIEINKVTKKVKVYNMNDDSYFEFTIK